jgi:simple sugar transport system ATP-binding protein
MVGRKVLFEISKDVQPPGDLVISIDNLNAENDKGLPALKRVSLQVRSGEILGLAGVAGNGQSELAEVITGLRPCTAGQVTINGERVSNLPARAAIDANVAYIPMDRTGVGTSPNLSITEGTPRNSRMNTQSLLLPLILNPASSRAAISSGSSWRARCLASPR